MKVYRACPNTLIMIMLTTVATFLIGVGVAFNAQAGLGNDPIAVFLDGFSKFLGIDLGTASNITNLILFIIVFILKRKYINIGTVVYSVGLGHCISVGVALYWRIGMDSTPFGPPLVAIIGCGALIVGIAVFVAANAGFDPWTGIVMILRDVTGKSYGAIKVVLDLAALVGGYVLGGVVGVVTIVVAVLGGPVVQWISRMMKSNL